MSGLLEFVERFATALDNDDYETAALCMEQDAVYDDNGGKTIVGRDAILESFRDASEWGRSNLDRLTFSHEIDDATPLQIRLIDVLACGGEELALDHTMHLLLSDHGLISAVRVAYPPGEEERVSAFFQRHGLRRKA